jgi:hypothetical protein
MINIVTNFQILQEFKKSRYFRINLGLIGTIEKNGKRSFNDQDKFSFTYNTNYNTTILGQGSVGDIKFYVDHFINDPIFAVYTDDNEEFIFDIDMKMIKEKGIEFYLGFILKTVEEEYNKKVVNNELKKTEAKPIGNPDNIFDNPGNVNYEDLKEYLKNKNKNRI